VLMQGREFFVPAQIKCTVKQKWCKKGFFSCF
jgi:hypothetical protein